MRMNVTSKIIFCLFTAVGTLFAQTTGEIIGTVSLEGNPLPGVVVTAESDALQGKRSVVTNANGSFLLRLLPPGQYELTAVMEGMATQKMRVAVPVGGVVRPKMELKPEATTEIITVTADTNAVLDSTQVTSNLRQISLRTYPVTAQSLVPWVWRQGSRKPDQETHPSFPVRCPSKILTY